MTSASSRPASGEPPRVARARSLETPAGGAARLLWFNRSCQLGSFFAKRRRARDLRFRLGARGHSARRGASHERPASATFPKTTDGTFRAARFRLPRLSSGSAVPPSSALAAAVASEHLEKLADQKLLETMPRVAELSRVIAKSALIYPVAFSMHAYALLSLPFSVSAALFRSLTGVSGKGMDELFASQFAPGGAGESDTALLRGLREKHKLAMAALHDQLDDSDSRYKVRSARGLSIAFSSRRFASSSPKRHDAQRCARLLLLVFREKRVFSLFSILRRSHDAPFAKTLHIT